MRNVAGREPAILQRVVVMTEIAIDHPVAAYQQIASRCAVARQFTADVINRLPIDAERWPALLRRQIGLGVGINRKMLGLEGVDGAPCRYIDPAPGDRKHARSGKGVSGEVKLGG